VINACQKSPSEGISQLSDDWIDQDLIDTSHSNLDISNHPIVERCLHSDFFGKHGSVYLFLSKTTRL
jgi:hypothetical protein